MVMPLHRLIARQHRRTPPVVDPIARDVDHLPDTLEPVAVEQRRGVVDGAAQRRPAGEAKGAAWICSAKRAACSPLPISVQGTTVR